MREPIFTKSKLALTKMRALSGKLIALQIQNLRKTSFFNLAPSASNYTAGLLAIVSNKEKRDSSCSIAIPTFFCMLFPLLTLVFTSLLGEFRAQLQIGNSVRNPTQDKRITFFYVSLIEIKIDLREKQHEISLQPGHKEGLLQKSLVRHCYTRIAAWYLPFCFRTLSPSDSTIRSLPFSIV